MALLTKEILETFCRAAADGNTQELTINEIVQLDEAVLDLTDQEYSSWQIETGENLSTTQAKQVVAQCYGYPVLRWLGNSENYRKMSIALLPVIELSTDRTEARFNLRSTPSGQPAIEAALVGEILRHQGIVFGIDDHAIRQSYFQLQDSGMAVQGRIIARGRAPVPGEDSWLRFEVEIGDIPGKILGDGSIDFRERRMFVPVKKGDLIAMKVPRTSGTPGRKVTGEETAAKEGRDIPVKVTEDVAFNEQDGTIRATASGVLTVVNGNAVRVSAKQQISGDVDFSTGNIRTQGNLEISGSICQGFIVSARGDVKIGGEVQSATVNCHGNVSVGGGVVGEDSQIHAQGDVDLSYIEHGELISGGNIILKGNAYYCHIQAVGNLCGPDSARIIGGKVHLGGSLVIGRIGSAVADPVDIAVGVDQKRYRRYQQLIEEHEKLVKELQAMLLRYGHKGKGEDETAERSQEIFELEKELNTLNLLAGSPEDSLGDRHYFFSAAEIRVSGKIAAGTTLRIANETAVLRDDISHVRVCMDPATGGILFIPF